MAEQWLSIVEYARTFAVSDMTVRRRIKTGRLRAVLREGKYYIPLSAGEGEREADIPADEMIHSESAEEILPVPPYVSAVPNSLHAQSSTKHLSLPINRSFEDRGEVPASRTGASFKTLPLQMIQSLGKAENSLVDTQGLLQYCDQSLTRINSIERHLQEGYQLRLQNVENQLKIKDGLIAQLKQQVEDLQMLVKLMEQNPKALVSAHLK